MELVQGPKKNTRGGGGGGGGPETIVTPLIGGQPIIISSCYCSPDPNSTDGLSKLLLNIQKALRFCQNSGIKGLAILGDFNAQSRQWGDRLQNPLRKLSEFVLKHGCSITAPPGNTFVSSNGGSIIDLCLAYGSITTALGRSWVGINLNYL